MLTFQNILLAFTLPIVLAFIGILVAFVLTYIKLSDRLSDKFSDLSTPLVRIEQHTARIPSLEEKLAELRVVFEERISRSVKMMLDQSKIEAVVSVKDKSASRALVEIVFRDPMSRRLVQIMPAPAQRILQDIPHPLVNFSVSALSITLGLATEDAKAAAEFTRQFLSMLDKELSRAKDWEKHFEEGLG